MSSTLRTPPSVRPRSASAGRNVLPARLIGAALLIIGGLPLYRLLDPAQTGLAGSFTVGFVDVYYEFMFTGLLLAIPAFLAGARFISPALLERWLRMLRTLLLRPRQRTFMLGAALLGAFLSGIFSLLVLEGKPSVIDAFAQLLQARYWADGALAGPASDHGGFWSIQNALFTPNGWVSQYPPGHVALLVPFFWLGAPWLYGPLAVFLTICATALIVWRIFPDDEVTARVAVALLAVSGFFLFVGGSLMNHITTAVCTCWGGYFLLRAWQDRRVVWSLPAGLLFAISLATRPLSTLAIGAAFAVMIPLLWRGSARRIVTIATGAVAGAVPVVLLWFAYNRHFFDSPLRSGYNVALGPSMGLGFGRDPWGNRYGPLEALAYTSSDLITLGVNLFETPLTAVLLIAVFLLLAKPLSRPVWLLLAWACVPVIANAFYWHHGIYMGPRMLHEAAPAWILLSGVAIVGLLRRIPADAGIAGRYWVRPGFVAALVMSFALGLLVLAPQRAHSYGGNWISVSRTPVPAAGDSALVFVHDAWNGRIAMTLASSGMRLDRIETIIRQNSTCRAHEVAVAVSRGDDAAAARLLAALDTVPRADRLPIPVEIAPGDGMRVVPGEVLTADCVREANSDRSGILDIAPLLWQTELHGRSGPGPLLVRDLGPERNAVLLARHPERTAWVYMADGPDGGVVLLPYHEGMARLWGAGRTRTPGVQDAVR